MGIRVLGALSVDGRAPGRRDRVVLAVLSLELGHPVSASRLAEALWGDRPPASAGKVLHGCVARLRAALGPDAILTTDHGYTLALSGDDVDAVRFERGVVRARELVALGDCDRALFAVTEALSLWAAPPYADLPNWDLALIDAARLDELRLQAEELRVEALLRTGDHDAALMAARTMVGESPLRERRWVQLSLAAYRAGHQSDALAALRRCRDLLREELGLDPGAEIDVLEQRILRQDPSLLPGEPSPRVSEECPWPGLMAYDAGDAESFFGREHELVSALALLRGRGVLAVVGPSGVGKSSLVRAGVVPAMRSAGASVETICPGPHPPAELPPTELLVVDQCEELFVLCTDAGERDAFVSALVHQARRGLLVLALRADRLADVAGHPDLARLVEQGLYLLGGLDEQGLRAVIEKPAARAGLRIEPGLVDLLLRDLDGEPGALPLLSHALVETWQRREGRTLTVDSYRASGGVRGAVAQSAEDVYARLAPDQQAALRAVMLRLVSAGPEGEPMRARMPRRLVASDHAQERLVEMLVGSRLVTSDDGVVTLAHEALARAWPRLRDWLDDDVEGRRVLHHLTASADAWDALGRPDSELYRGVRLVRALDWRRGTPVRLAPVERDFLTASRTLADAEERSAAAQARHHARVNRRLRALAVGLACFLAMALVAGAVALRQTHRADAAALSADAGRVGATALLTDDIPRSLLLAVAAARLAPSTVTHANLEAGLARHPELVATGALPTAGVLSRVELGPDAHSLLVTDRNNRVHRVSLDTMSPGASYQAGGDEGNAWEVPVVQSRRAGVVAVAAAPADALPIRLLDPATLQPVPDQLGGWPRRDAVVASLAVSANGRYLAAAVVFPHILSDTDGFLEGAQAVVWDLTAPGRPVVRRITITENFFNGVALSPRGDTLYVTNPLTAYDVRSGRRLWAHEESGFDLVIGAQPTGGHVAVADAADGSDVALVDGRTGAITERLRGHQARVTAVRFSHDGRTVAAVAQDGLALTWHVGSGELLHRIEVGTTRVTGLAFSADDRTLYTVAGDAQQIAAWDLDGFRSFLRRVPVSAPVEVGNGMVRPGHLGSLVAFMQQAEERPDLRIVDTVRNRTTTLPTRALAWSGAGSWNPEDTRYAVGYGDGVVQVFDTTTGRSLAQRRVLTGMVTEVSHSADGHGLAAVDDAGHVVLLDAETLRPVGRPVTVPEKAYALTAAPDGHTAFVSAGGTSWRPYWDVPITHWYLVDLAAGRIIRHGNVAVRNAIYSSYSPDGRHVAVGGRQGEVVLIDTETGRPVHRPTVGHQGDVYWVAYNRSGSRFTTGSTGHDVALWDGRSGELLGTAVLPETEATAMAGFRPDGSLLIASFSGHLFRWDPSLTHAIEFACGLAHRDLSASEWAAELPDRPRETVCPQ